MTLIQIKHALRGHQVYKRVIQSQTRQSKLSQCGSSFPPAFICCEMIPHSNDPWWRLMGAEDRGANSYKQWMMTSAITS